MRNVLKSYQKRLVNLSSNNKSLLLRKLLKGQYIDLHRFDFLQKEPSFSIIKKLIRRKKSIDLSPVADSRDEQVNMVSRDLTRLERLNNFLFDEHGSKDLYIGWPFVRGKFTDGTHTSAPLLFFPVALQKTNNKWTLIPRSDISILLNKLFLLSYGYHNGININEEITEQNLEDFDLDPLVFRTSLYHFLKKSQVEINFNSENFADTLQSFSAFNKQSFNQLHKNGELKLFPEAVLGIFPQSGSYLVPDYEKMQEDSTFSDLEEFFASKHVTSEGDTKYAFLNRVKEEVTYTPLKMDAYQENALKAAKLGKSFVVQGPPGTGKSQLITNLISDFVARGKRILLVSQKRAALDVVYNRLDALGMQNFIGLVHDFRNDRKNIYKKIAGQTDKIEEYKQLNNTLDSIQLERQFWQYSKQIDALTEEMDAFKSALFDESECGISVKELYLSSNLKGVSVNVKQEYQYFNFNEIVDLVTRSKRYASYASIFRKEKYTLFDRKSFSTYDISSLKRMQEILEEIAPIKKLIATQTKKVVSHPIEIEECISILDKKKSAHELLSKLDDFEVYDLFKQLMRSHTRSTDYTWLSNHEKTLMTCFKEVGVEKSLNTEEIDSIQATLQAAINAHRGVFKYMKWWFSKDRKKIDEILVKNQLKTNRTGIKSLSKLIDNRLNLDHNLSVLQRKGWVKKYDGVISKEALQSWFHSLKEAFKCKIIFYSYRNFKEYFNPDQLSFKELSSKINALYRVIEHIPETWNSWSIYYTENQLRKITSDTKWLQRVDEVLENDFDDLCDFDKLRDSLPSYEITVADKVILVMDVFEEHKYESILINSLKLEWINHIETKFPVLRAVSSKKFRQMEDSLQNNIREKLRISNEILLLRAREKIYENIEYNRLNNMVTYREIKHQVTKQRKIWPLRKLIANHSIQLFDLIPCWMASPEAVSAIFPMKKLFDIVIFDEASQCFTEQGIPAMFRGNQLVIAGDNQQLRPNDLYKARWDEMEEENIALEVDSLLELSEQYLMNINLQGHYRSKKAELIAFSNKHFYQNNLRLLPDKKLVNEHKPAINYIKLDGIWENNTNLIEAEKIIEIIKNQTKTAPQKSIGVVTFNAKQQELILDLLDEEVIQSGFFSPPSLMVKNIENVQGDERDIIIFSTAYAPNKLGKMIMQFGSLNISGGENRLNVAITRAKESIMIVTSIWPNQLKVEGLKNKGPKYLKEYLIFAKLVSDGKYEPKPNPPSAPNANWYFKNKIINWANKNCPAYTFKKELPFADITVKKGKDYCVLFLTDDDLYLQNPSIKDLHAYTPFTLSKNNWAFLGFFSREWWKQRESVQERIMQFLNHHT